MRVEIYKPVIVFLEKDIPGIPRILREVWGPPKGQKILGMEVGALSVPQHFYPLPGRGFLKPPTDGWGDWRSGQDMKLNRWTEQCPEGLLKPPRVGGVTCQRTVNNGGVSLCQESGPTG